MIDWPHSLILHVCISVFRSLSGVGWNPITDAAQPVISAVITSLIQLLPSGSPSSLLLSHSTLSSFLSLPQCVAAKQTHLSHTVCPFIFALTYYSLYCIFSPSISFYFPRPTPLAFFHVGLNLNEWVLLISRALGQCAQRLSDLTVALNTSAELQGVNELVMFDTVGRG